MAKLADATDSKSVPPSNQPPTEQQLTNDTKGCGALSGACVPTDAAGLATVNDAWSALPDAVKTGIVAMVESVRK